MRKREKLIKLEDMRCSRENSICSNQKEKANKTRDMEAPEPKRQKSALEGASLEDLK